MEFIPEALQTGPDSWTPRECHRDGIARSASLMLTIPIHQMDQLGARALSISVTLPDIQEYSLLFISYHALCLAQQDGLKYGLSLRVDHAAMRSDSGPMRPLING